MSRTVIVLILSSIASLGVSPSVHAQATSRLAQLPVIIPQPTPTAPRVTVRFQNTSVRIAVQTIVDQGNLALVYSPESIPAQRRVTYTGANVVAEDALAAVLSGTGLRVEHSDGGRLRLVAVGTRSTNRANGTLTGKVTDAETGRPIAGANVSIDGTARGVITNEMGVFHFTSLTAGQHTITIKSLGYTKTVRTVTVSDDAATTLDVTLQAGKNVLDQVVVTGSVIPTERRTIPNTMTVITADDIQRRGITNITQLFRGDVPGLVALNTGTLDLYGDVRMYSRGHTSPSTSPAIKTYVDGIEMADPTYLAQIDPNQIERIEVIPGPQASTIYGSGALGGVMQIFTKHGSASQPKLSATFLTGSVQNNFSDKLTPQHDDALQLDGGKPDFTYHLGGTYRYVGQWKPGTYIRNAGGDVGLSYTTGALNATGTVRLAQRAAGHGEVTPLFATRSADGTLTTSLSDLIAYQRDLVSTQMTLGATATYQPREWWQNSLTVGQDGNTNTALPNSPRFTNPTDTFQIAETSPVTRTSIGYNTTLRGTLGDAFTGTLTLGVDHFHYIRNYSYTFGPSTVGTLTSGAISTVIQRDDINNHGEFAQAQVGLLDRVFLTAGLRAEGSTTYGADVGTVYAPRLGISIVQDVGGVSAKLRAAYGRSTRPPDDGSTEAAYSSSPIYGLYLTRSAAPDLRPEEQHGWEEGLELYAGSVASLSITHYNQMLTDAILTLYPADSTRSILPDPVTQQYTYAYSFKDVNVAALRNDGWETQGTLRFGPLSAAGTYSMTRSRLGYVPAAFMSSGFATGGSLNYTPEHTGSLTLSYSTSKVTVTASASIIGQVVLGSDSMSIFRGRARLPILQSRISTPSPYYSVQSGYTTTDINASYLFTKRVSAIVKVQNLGDSYHNDYSFSTPVTGRSTLIGFRIQ